MTFLRTTENTKTCGVCPKDDRVELTCEAHGIRTDGEYIALAIGNGFRYPTTNNEQPGIYEDETGAHWEFLEEDSSNRRAGGMFGRWRNLDKQSSHDLPGYDGISIALRWVGPSRENWDWLEAGNTTERNEEDGVYQYLRETSGALYRRKVGAEISDWEGVETG